MGEMRNACTFSFVENPEGNMLFRIPGCRWSDNIKIEPKDLGRNDV